MKHLAALIIKFILIMSVLGFVLGYSYGWYYPVVMLIGAIITVVGYVVGDLWILPRGGNLTASSADFGISIILIWVIGSLLFQEPVYTTGPIFASLLISIIEWFFHNYMMSRVTLTQNQSKA